jgi:hypothetical protein
MKYTLTILLTVFCLSAKAQLLHTKTMRFFAGDWNTSLLNVYDLKKESLIKSINCDNTDIIVKLTFNKDETKIYRLVKNVAHVIDVATLDIQKYELLPDKDIELQSIEKNLALKKAEEDRVKKEISNQENMGTKNLVLKAPNGTTPELIKNEEMKNAKELPISIFPVGISENGIAIIQRNFVSKSEYSVFDLKQAGKKINSFELSTNSSISMHEGNILAFVQDGTIDIINPLTGKNIGKIENAFDIKDLDEVRTLNAAKENKSIYATHYTNGKYLFTRLTLGQIPNTIDFNQAHTIYDLSSKNIIYKQRNTEYTTGIVPIDGSDLFQKVVAKTPKPELKLPEQPDQSKFTAKDIKKGLMTKAYEEWSLNYKKINEEFIIKAEAYNNPQNFSQKIYSDINATQELFSVDATRYLIMKGDIVICYKELSIEFYDIKTKKLLHTLYFD